MPKTSMPVVCFTPHPKRLEKWRELLQADGHPGCVPALDLGDALDAAIRMELPAVLELIPGREMVRSLSLIGKITHLLKRPIALLTEEVQVAKIEMRAIPEQYWPLITIQGDPRNDIQFLRAARELLPMPSAPLSGSGERAKRRTARLAMSNGTYHLEQINLQELIKLCYVQQRSGVLNIESGDEGGSLFFEDGRPLHVEQGDRTGLPAYEKICGWQEGIARWEPCVTLETARTLTQDQVETMLGLVPPQ